VADDRHDVAIVGGGLIGLSIAWRARQLGLDVLVLERDEPGATASFVGAGILAPVSEPAGGPSGLEELAIVSCAAYPAFADELAEESGEPVDLRRCGVLRLARSEAEAAELRALQAAQLARGRRAEWLDEASWRALEPGVASCVGGLHTPEDGVVDARTLTRALLRILGDTVAAGRGATGALRSANRLTGVETSDGPVRAEHVVVAAGAWSGALDWLPREARPPVRPVKGQLLVLRPAKAEQPPGPVVWTRDVYAAARADGRVVVGGTVEDAGFDVAVAPEAEASLRTAAAEALPSLAGYELAESLAGLRPGSRDGAPIIGPGTLEGLVLATGHFRKGILLAPATADAVAALLVGDPVPPLLEPFAPGRFDGTSAAS
jgi:glycine oxidase